LNFNLTKISKGGGGIEPNLVCSVAESKLFVFALAPTFKKFLAPAPAPEPVPAVAL
jgi:hypothetical protein